MQVLFFRVLLLKDILIKPKIKERLWLNDDKNKPRKKITAKERHFCHYYLSTGNAKEAAVLADFKNNPEKIGLNLLAKKIILDEIDKIYKEKKKSLIYKACIGYERLAFGDISDAIRLLCAGKIDEKTLSSMDLFNIAEIKCPKEGAMEIKFFDRIRALEKLEQSDMKTKNDINPFYYAIEKGVKNIGIEKE